MWPKIDMRARNVVALLSLALLASIAVAPLTPALAQAPEPKPITTEGEWITALQSRLQAAKRISRETREHARPGWHEVRISFHVSRSGAIVDTTIAQSSGEPTIDADAQAMLVRIAPLPPFPAAMEGDTRKFTLPLRFQVPELKQTPAPSDGNQMTPQAR